VHRTFGPLNLPETIHQISLDRSAGIYMLTRFNEIRRILKVVKKNARAASKDLFPLSLVGRSGGWERMNGECVVVGGWLEGMGGVPESAGGGELSSPNQGVSMCAPLE